MLGSSLALAVWLTGCSDQPEEAEPVSSSPVSEFLAGASVDDFSMADHVSACMSAEGFDVAIPVDVVRLAVPSENVSFVPDGYGFGITTLLVPASDLSTDDLLGLTEENEHGPAADEDQMLEAVPPEQLEPFVEALYGENGCLFEAARIFEEFENVFQVDLAEIEAAASSSPRVAEIRWAVDHCLEAAGFDGVERVTSSLESGTQEWLEAYHEAGGIVTVALEDQLQQLQREELRAHEAAATCENELGGSVRSVYRDVRFELEAEFLATERDEVQDFLETHER